MSEATIPARKTDAELIAYLRAKLWQVQEAAFNFGEVMQVTGTDRAGAMERVKIIMPYALAELLGLGMTDSRLALFYRAVDALIKVFDAGGPARVAAWEAVHTAMQQSFFDALQSSPDATDDILAHWFDPAQSEVVAAIAQFPPETAISLDDRAADLAPFGSWCEHVEGLNSEPREAPYVPNVKMRVDHNGMVKFYDADTGQPIEEALYFKHEHSLAGVLPTTPGHLTVIDYDDKQRYHEKQVPAFLVSVEHYTTHGAQ